MNERVKIAGRAALGAFVALAASNGLISAPALAAAPVGLRPLGGDWEAARSVEAGRWVLEAGAEFNQLDAGGVQTAADQDVYDRWNMLPVWPQVRGIYGLEGGTAALVQLGPIVGGGYRRPFLRADAPWGNEYLQAFLQAGGGLHLAGMRPVGYVRLPAIYERGAWTFHVAPGGYYMFNQQPIVDVKLGVEVRPLEALTLGGHALLRMDAKKLTPMDGTWAMAGGTRYQLGERWALSLEGGRDDGPPVLAESPVAPVIEFARLWGRASVTFVY